MVEVELEEADEDSPMQLAAATPNPGFREKRLIELEWLKDLSLEKIR
jgi:hypothetical protein